MIIYRIIAPVIDKILRPITAEYFYSVDEAPTAGDYQTGDYSDTDYQTGV